MEAEEVETGFTPANETEKLATPSIRETTFINNPEAEQLDDLSDIEVGFMIVHKQTIKLVDHPFCVKIS
jgi:hypothetical protein